MTCDVCYGTGRIGDGEYKIKCGACLANGTKFDGGKPMIDLVPPEALLELAKVLTYGANKYAPRNWEKGISWGRLFAAMQRHAWAWWSGEDTDEESGMHHLSHLLCCAAMLVASVKRDIGEDTRHES